MIEVKCNDSELVEELLKSFRSGEAFKILGFEYMPTRLAHDYSSLLGYSVEFDADPVMSARSEWTGTGLPPVGTVCEMTHEHWGHRGWEKVKVNYCSAEYAITADGHGEQHWHMRNIRFRPIKTQALIEAEAREKAIMGIYQTICISRAQAEAIYDAGYRKQPTNQPQEDK